MSSVTQQRRFLSLQTTLGPDALVVTHASGSERLGRPFELTVDAFADTDDIDFNTLLGSTVTLRLGLAERNNIFSEDHTRYFHGHVIHCAHAGYRTEGLATYRLTIAPWLWFLTRTSDCKIFQNESVPAIVESIFQDHGFSNYELRLQRSYEPREFCVQYRESDFDFVSRLLEHEGIYYYFRHEEGGHVLVLCDSMSNHEAGEDFERLHYVGGDKPVAEEAVVTSWEWNKRVKTTAVALNDYNFERPVPDTTHRLLSRSSIERDHSYAHYERYDYPGTFHERALGETYAQIRVEEAQAEHETVRGESTAAGLKAGSLFELVHYPKADQNRQHLLTGVSWSATSGGYASGRNDGEQFFSCEFTAIPAETCTFRPARTTPIPRVQGCQTAMVVGPDGEEIYVDDHSRVKVQFHWDRYGRANADSSCWIRVSQPWAGGAFGGLAIPRIGHEVVVDFLEGDPDRPLIVGRLYNANTMPIVTNAGREDNPARSARERVREKRKAKAKAKSKNKKAAARS